MAQALDTIVARLTADLGSFQRGMAAASAELDRLRTAAGGAGNALPPVEDGAKKTGIAALQAHRGFRIMENGLRGLAFQAVGIQGPIGRLSHGLLSFAGGGVVTVGVLAGIALLVKGFTSLKRAAEEAEKRIGELRRTFAGLKEDQIALLRLRVADINAPAGGRTTAQLEARRQLLVRGLSSQFGIGKAGADELLQVGTELLLRREITKELERQIALIQQATAAQRREIFEGPRRRLTELAETANLPLGLGARFQRGFVPGVRQPTDRQLTNAATRAEQLGQVITDSMRRGIEESEINEQLAAIGESAVRALIRGFMEGGAKLEDILKNFIIELFSFSVLKGLNKLFKFGSPSQVGIDMGANFARSFALGMTGMAPALAGGTKSMAGAALSLNLSMDMRGMPAAGDPRQAARDAQWQAFLRESVKVARHDGFR